MLTGSVCFSLVTHEPGSATREQGWKGFSSGGCQNGPMFSSIVDLHPVTLFITLYQIYITSETRAMTDSNKRYVPDLCSCILLYGHLGSCFCLWTLMLLPRADLNNGHTVQSNVRSTAKPRMACSRQLSHRFRQTG